MFLFGTIQIHKNKNNLCTEDIVETYFTRKITHEKKKIFFFQKHHSSLITILKISIIVLFLKTEI